MARKYRVAVAEHNSHREGYRDFYVNVDDDLRTEWLKEVDAWDREHSNATDPYELLEAHCEFNFSISVTMITLLSHTLSQMPRSVKWRSNLKLNWQ